MEALFTDIAIVAAAVWAFLWLLRKWRKLNLEALQNEIKEVEANYKTIEEIEKNCPDYKKKKETIAKFIKQ